MLILKVGFPKPFLELGDVGPIFSEVYWSVRPMAVSEVISRFPARLGSVDPKYGKTVAMCDG